MNATLDPVRAETSQALQDTINTVCRRIPPLWPLKTFVAVNPFVGLAGRHFIEAAQLIQKVGHGGMLMPASFYLANIEAGKIQDHDLQTAVQLAKKTLPPELAEKMIFPDLAALKRALEKPAVERPFARVLTFADFLDRKTRTGWATFVLEEISKWCSAYYDQGQSSWRMPWHKLGLFAAWKSAARLDANPELMGLKQFRAFAAALPDDHWEFIDRALGNLGVSENSPADFLHRLLMSLPGWSSYVQYLVRERNMAGGHEDSLAQLLAIRLAYDLALQQQFGRDAETFGEWQEQLASVENDVDSASMDLLARFVALQALECGYQNELIPKLRRNASQRAASVPKSLQAVFCIDVRSEVFRRALEAQSEEIETIGFAGFFGMAIEYLKFGQPSGGAQCPVLLTPKFKVREAMSKASGEASLLRRMKFRQNVNSAWNAFKTSAISCFSFVETAGLWFGVKLAKDSLALTGPHFDLAKSNRGNGFKPKIDREVFSAERNGPSMETGIALGDQIALAAGALKNMGLVSHFAKVVLLCGHGSATSNNPYGSALDCGACGGHAGDANARVAAAILNKSAVREGLKAQGIEIPADTIFIAGLHNTTTDEIVIYQDEPISANQRAELETMKVWLSAASKEARRERAASVGLAGLPDAELQQKVFARARDWSQVRPEWGLAGNAAFVAAPRARTKGLNLGGRVFLHDYHTLLDADKSTLELILTAPMVVASWINLQYYGSTVDNRLFGSGNKVLHNVVGTFGVWQGNGGDLQPGLPLQSLHDGARWRHEPLRLSVFIEARREDVAAILRKQPEVRNLVENQWVHLFTIDPGGERLWQHLTAGRWVEHRN